MDVEGEEARLRSPSIRSRAGRSWVVRYAGRSRRLDLRAGESTRLTDW
jgi:hypothetical protein